jgi:hypothetical protein
MILRSIRWRLTVSYVALTILTIGLVGALSIYFIKTNVERQEQEYLRTTAQSVMGEITSLLSAPGESSEALQELVDITGYLGDLRLTLRDKAAPGKRADSSLADRRCPA